VTKYLWPLFNIPTVAPSCIFQLHYPVHFFNAHVKLVKRTGLVRFFHCMHPFVSTIIWTLLCFSSDMITSIPAGQSIVNISLGNKQQTMSSSRDDLRPGWQCLCTYGDQLGHVSTPRGIG